MHLDVYRVSPIYSCVAIGIIDLVYYNMDRVSPNIALIDRTQLLIEILSAMDLEKMKDRP